MRLNNTIIDLSKPRVMTIINITPDSFYDGSRCFTEEQIERKVLAALDEGADMFDVGGYSSRPNADNVAIDEEIRRIARAMEVIRRTVEEFGDCIVNDISAGELDPTMVETVAELRLPYVAMHMRGTPTTMQKMTSYSDVVEDVRKYFLRKIEQLREAGIEDIVVDAGFGFAKSLDQNYELMRGLHRLTDLGVPLLVGISRKSMIYQLLGCTPDKALNGTTALHMEALRQGAKILRVHDTREAKEVITIFNKLNKIE